MSGRRPFLTAEWRDRVIAWTAHALYNEPYRALPMRHARSTRDGERTIAYEWREGADWIGLSAITQGSARGLRTGSKAEFITEHFWGYTRQRDGGTVEYRVAHPRYDLSLRSGQRRPRDPLH